MRGPGRLAAGVVCAASFATPVAHASQGSDQVTRGTHAFYTADPGEANRLTLDTWGSDQNVHLGDAGAIIRWLSIPTASECAGGVHDVFCTSKSIAIHADLGDGDDAYTSTINAPGDIKLGPGDDTARGGTGGEGFYGGPGADDISGGPGGEEFLGGPAPEFVSYEDATGPVTVTGDDVANDGTAGEGDNIHPDVEEIYGTAFGDTISGYYSIWGGDGDDMLTGDARSNNNFSGLYGGEGNDVLDGAAGRDNLIGHAGDDVFHARDGEADHIWCGLGTDVVEADAVDVIETPVECETLQLPAKMKKRR